MAMIEHNPNIKLNLRKQDVERYVVSHGWQQVEHPNKYFQVFDGELDYDGNPIRLVLPIDERPKDTDLRIIRRCRRSPG
jgi:hypothetical protein